MQIIAVSCGGVHNDFHIDWSAHRLAFRFFQPDVSMSLQQFQCRKNPVSYTHLDVYKRQHIDFVQVHGKVSQTARLKFQQTGFVIPLELILTDRILIILSAGVAFQLKGENGNAVEEDYKVNALPLFVPDFLHHREYILLIQRLCFLVEGGGKMCIRDSYMGEHSDTVTLKDIAKRFSYHPNYISTLLHREIGKSFSEILLEQMCIRDSSLEIEKMRISPMANHRMA